MPISAAGSFHLCRSLPSSAPGLCNVAVIGAGSSGLVAARELRRAGHNVVIFERESRVGGTWIYNPRTESDLIGVDPSREIVHSSLYASLRTNLPRESMGFRDFPFISVDDVRRDPRRFPSHTEVLSYINDFSEEFGLRGLVRFETEVVRLEVAEKGGWNVRYMQRHEGFHQDELYDAVVVCSGHFTEPQVVEIPGIQTWPGKQIHSHNYRTPEGFQDQVVVIVGNASSASDISYEISGFAAEVHIIERSQVSSTKKPGCESTFLHPMINRAQRDGSIVFQDGNAVHADTILHCTGYKYHFPFLETKGVVSVEDNRVGPLYKHVFPPSLAPFLSFVGLPWKVIPFPLVEYQSRWIAGTLAGKFSLPSKEDMLGDVDRLYSDLRDRGVPKRYTHNLLGHQFEYNDWLAKECSCEASEEWRKKMYVMTSENRLIRPKTYRDEWDDCHWIAEAHKDFTIRSRSY